MTPKTQYQKMRDNRARLESRLASAREWTPVAGSGNLEMSSVVLEDGSVLTATGPQSGQGGDTTELSGMIARGGDAGLYVSIKAGGAGLGGSTTGGGGGGWGQAVGAPAHDPHAELRKTWAPGQRWQGRMAITGAEWIDYPNEPRWLPSWIYRRHPSDIDQEKPWIKWPFETQPPETVGVLTDILTRDGSVFFRKNVDSKFFWTDCGGGGDPIAYRVSA